MSKSTLTKKSRDEIGAAEWHFETYAEASREAARIGKKDGFVTKIQRSPYAAGFVVVSLPVKFFMEPMLRHLFMRPIDYSDL